MSFYKKSIIEDTGCDPVDAPAVEGVMRDAHGTLDGLTKIRFRTAARKAHAYVLALKEALKDPDRSAKDLGWSREELDQVIEYTLTTNARLYA